MQRKDHHIKARFDRQYRKIALRVPGMKRLGQPGWMVFRVVFGLLFVIAGLLAVLPVLGLWMIPVGLLLLAIDLPILQGPVSRLLIRGRRWIALRRRR
ncbi:MULTISPECIES: hypothetical protein [Yoonia]|jgi:hypothetical protein|uniref:Tryptophan synthase subunit beta n=1 Tax=Yoonia vestfoldensis SKA53 TaxID=314232 RepID=A3V5B2_9RHOB|nr:hypothetical protein [Yoonia vestfoldensis]EAQ06830.1 hypothetical protein SKA53_14821 [Yoonia vestfoldensis SKA53]